MSRVLPPLDMHAHVDPGVSPRSLEQLGAVVFVATRSLDEYQQASSRTDAVTVWGVGCHPGIAAAQAAYDEAHFSAALAATAYVSEVGLDDSSAVPIDRQVEVFGSILAQVSNRPRLISIHSKRATTRTIDLIEHSGVRGSILHWWLGSVSDTRRAIDLGCLFSINRSMDVARLLKAGVPLNCLLPETDHPSGNRGGDGPCQPGWTIDVEKAVATSYGVGVDEVRQYFWDTLVREVDRCGVVDLMPPVVQAMLRQARSTRSA
ncbi:TatD family hydrolase [Mycobacterium sp. NPDC003449]